MAHIPYSKVLKGLVIRVANFRFLILAIKKNPAAAHSVLKGAARAVAQRVQVAEHTLRRHRVHPHTQDDLAFPATLPSSDD